MILRFRLRSVLVLLSLIVLILPVAGIQLLRLYESALVRQTESELIAQAVVLVALYRAEYVAAQTNAARRTPNPPGEPMGSAFPSGPSESGLANPPAAFTDLPSNNTEPRPTVPSTPAASTIKNGPAPSLPNEELDLAITPIYEPLELVAGKHAPDVVAAIAGARIAAVVEETQRALEARIRVIDHRGIVVTSSVADTGSSLGHAPEVQAALAGERVSRLRKRSADDVTLAAISRSSAIRVFVTAPVVENGRVLGAVMLSRTPTTILQALYGKRFLLLQAAAVILAVVVMVAIFAARTVVNPIQRLAQDADAVARGERETIGRERPYRTIEVDQLATRVREMASSLQQRSSYVRDFARHVSHEFKTPISAIHGTIEVLRDHLDTMTASERQRFFDNVEGDLARLERLTQGLLELAHADMTKKTSETTTLAEVDIDDVSITGVTNVPMAISHESMHAALTHLVNNAFQHGATRVDVRADATADSVEIMVTDDGEGIPAANAQRIFDPFFTTKRDSGGTGLGLAITRALIGNVGGRLELLNAAVGTQFALTVPRANY